MTALFPDPRDADDERKRLHESLARQCEQILKTLDAALALRTAPQEAQKSRHLARQHLIDFYLRAMHAHDCRRS